MELAGGTGDHDKGMSASSPAKMATRVLAGGGGGALTDGAGAGKISGAGAFAVELADCAPTGIGATLFCDGVFWAWACAVSVGVVVAGAAEPTVATTGVAGVAGGAEVVGSGVLPQAVTNSAAIIELARRESWITVCPDNNRNKNESRIY